MNLWDTVDFSNTIRTYEYTRRAKYQIYQVIGSEDFRDMDSSAIFHFILDKMEIIPFHSYLKRYIDYKVQSEEALTEKEYCNVICNAFMEHSAPYSYKQEKARPKVIAGKWLKKKAVTRDTIFIIGFGLGMDDIEVSEFLTKVNKEESFDFSNPREAIFWYCFHNGKGYGKAKELLSFYEQIECPDKANDHLWEAMKRDPKMYLHSEKELKTFLGYLKIHNSTKEYDEFYALYKRAQKTVADIHNVLVPVEGGKVYISDDITPVMIENMLYSGIKAKNSLKKMSLSELSAQFTASQRLDRIHIYNILAGRDSPTRYDFLNLLFLIYANNIYYDYDGDERQDGAAERTRDYIDEINGILSRCNMAGIYPVNPYEAFVLLCLATEDPLSVFCEIWEYSYRSQP